MPATPRIRSEPSPTTVPPNSAASSASVRVLICPPRAPKPARSTKTYRLIRAAAGCVGIQFREDLVRDVETAIRIDDVARRGVEHEVQPALAGDLLHGAADECDDLVRGAPVLLGGAAVGSPHLL